MSRFLILMLLSAPLAAQEQSSSENKAPADPEERFRITLADDKLQSIRDNAPFPWLEKERELGKDAPLYMEESAYDDVLIHASKLDHADLEARARRDVQFGDLVNSGRGDYRLELIRLEGKLLRLRKAPVNQPLKLQGIENLYEAWVFPKGESSPLCLYFTQLPEGLTPQTDLSKSLEIPVVVTGYFFKLLRYEQQAFNRSTPGKHKIWAAPVLIGKSITVLDGPDLVDAGLAWRMKFVPVAIGGFTLLALTLAFISWRYRSGDKAEMERQRERRNQNPFENV